MNYQHHPWHHISPGNDPADHINAIIEISKGSRAKYEIDKISGILSLDRVLFSSMYYPANYGFIPRSYGGDNDPLDIMVISQVSIEPLCLVRTKVIGVMRMLDGGLEDDKILAVADKDPSVNFLNDVTDLPDHQIHELKNFFEEYTKLENKTVVVDKFLGKAEAIKIIQIAIASYQKNFPESNIPK